MELKTSQFESSEMLATYLASTPLLEESWRMCGHANATAQMSFAVNFVGDVAYVAFSGVQMVECDEESCRNLVDLESSCPAGIFSAVFTNESSSSPPSSSSLSRSSDDDDHRQEPVMIHGGLLQLFLSYYYNPKFQNEILEILYKSRSIVFTGHSLGGAIASLTALWLLCVTQNSSPSISILCITYGATMLGNKTFSRKILQEKWAGKFCHVAAQHDIVPRLLFAPATPFVNHLKALFEFWQLSMMSAPFAQDRPALKLPDPERVELYGALLTCGELACQRGGVDEDDVGDGDIVGWKSRFWPFGSYMFCTENGAICLDNAAAVVKLLHLMLASGSADKYVGDHLRYDDYVGKLRWKCLQKNVFGAEFFVSSEESASEVGIGLALQSSGLASQELTTYKSAKTCLEMARQLGFRRNINSAKMAKSLAKITPLRSQIEWYKAYCDNSDDQMGYYDSFKRRTASKKGSKIYINLIRLGQFWDEVIRMFETNQLTPDFHTIPKYVNASHFYKLLVEPLEIAEYYRTGQHKVKGHYVDRGRHKRFKIFDRWWRERKSSLAEEEVVSPRSKFAGLTQDSCFWARVEEAVDCIYYMRTEGDCVRRMEYLDKIEWFERYADGMVERKEVSTDVLSKNSSYVLFRDEWAALKSEREILVGRFLGGKDGMVKDATKNGFLADFRGGNNVV